MTEPQHDDERDDIDRLVDWQMRTAPGHWRKCCRCLARWNGDTFQCPECGCWQ